MVSVNTRSPSMAVSRVSPFFERTIDGATESSKGSMVPTFEINLETRGGRDRFSAHPPAPPSERRLVLDQAEDVGVGEVCDLRDERQVVPVERRRDVRHDGSPSAL